MSAKEGYKFEELSVGMAHETHHTITEEDIELFAKVSGDYNPIQLDEEYAKKTPFGQRIAHGALTASYISGILGNDLPGPGAIFTHLEMRFRRPVFIGDTLHATSEVIALRESKSRPDTGIVTFLHEAVNQRGEVVCRCERSALLKKAG